MATKTLLTQIKLRKDNESNYQGSFIPLDGEVCLVDTPLNGLRAKVGNGSTQFRDLPFVDEEIRRNIIVSGEYKDGKFYTDNTYTEEIVLLAGTIYVSQGTKKVYVYDESNELILINETLPTASDTTIGTMKLYSNSGSHTDGTMTQKAITDALNKKVGASVNGAEGLLILA